MSQNRQYTNAVLTSLQRIFGEGFMSPGGAPDVARTLEGFDLGDARVLDLGCGLGGASRALAGDLGATRVTAVDIESENIAVASALIDRVGLSDHVTFEQVAPDGLPFSDGTFDIVYCTAVTCHIADKAAFFREPRRVLAAGGTFLGADWMPRAETGLSRAYDVWEEELANAGLVFTFETAEVYERAFRAAGFANVRFRDESENTLDAVAGSVDLVEGAAREELLAAMGDAGYESFRRRCIARVDALTNGDLRYVHFFAS